MEKTTIEHLLDLALNCENAAKSPDNLATTRLLLKIKDAKPCAFEYLETSIPSPVLVFAATELMEFAKFYLNREISFEEAAKEIADA